MSLQVRTSILRSRVWFATLGPESRPIRAMMVAVFVNTLGSGVFIPISVIYFTKVVGLPITQVATALAVASIAGMFSGVPLGRLADRLGAREVQIVLVCGMGVLTIGYAFVSTFWMLLVFATLLRVLDRGVAAVGGALIAGATTGASRGQARAYLRVMMNLGMALGAAISILVLQSNSPDVFKTVIIVDAFTYVLTGLLYLRLPRIPPTAPRNARPWGTLRDRRYLCFVALISLLAVHDAVLVIGIPLWVVDELDVPSGLAGAAFLINTVGIVLLMVPVSNRVIDLASAAKGALTGGVLAALTCGALALSAALPVSVAVAVVLVAVLVHLGGELFLSAVQFYLSFELADDDAQGEYQGLMTTGMALGTAIAPLLIALLPMRVGAPGWGVIAVILLVASLGIAAIATWASSTMQAELREVR